MKNNFSMEKSIFDYPNFVLFFVFFLGGGGGVRQNCPKSFNFIKKKCF